MAYSSYANVDTDTGYGYAATFGMTVTPTDIGFTVDAPPGMLASVAIATPEGFAVVTATAPGVALGVTVTTTSEGNMTGVSVAPLTGA
jgi:hypothetical protein